MAGARAGIQKRVTQVNIGKFKQKLFMSDVLLRMWPQQAIKEDKTDSIRDGLIFAGVIAQTTDEWKLVYNTPGNRIHEYLETAVKIESDDEYFEQLSIMIEPFGQAPMLTEEAEDFEYVERRNVVSITGGEGGSEDEWERLRQLLERITDDKYEAGYDLM